MPISASAKKSLRVAERRAGENKIMKLRIRKQVKQTTPDTLGQAFRLLDKAAKRNVIHKNKAARLKSRLAAKMAQTETVAAAPAKKSKKA